MDIQLDSITVEKEQYTVFQNLSVTFREKRWTAVVGQNGVGKSTLLEVVKKLYKPKSGTVTAPDNIGYLFQHADAQFFEPTVEKELQFAPLHFGWSKEKIQQGIAEVLEMVQLDASVLVKSPYQLSGGQKKRLALAVILILQPTVLLVDEPTAGLDPMQKKMMLDVLKKWQLQGNTLICITHEMEEVLAYGDDVYMMKKTGDHQMKTVEECFFKSPDSLLEAGLALPPSVACFHDVQNRLQTPLNPARTNDKLLRSIVEGMKINGILD
ncbi:ATP-binding cassette domain-containing protein [Paenibacillus sediminis]|uniref:Energy-coupling factor transport system ATP-binding protein n=1 Tax=Paenibacillus sediminis TaxID=664909 RepID=A0ABS4H566_9BACL|nr:ATP-binding cassette domain-containing protein [Paenibacillus sediminis]MBP1937631.1 energy-coupling factor transport system ATP-binding protein [Paenibacillus sediminis]